MLDWHVCHDKLVNVWQISENNNEFAFDAQILQGPHFAHRL